MGAYDIVQQLETMRKKINTYGGFSMGSMILGMIAFSMPGIGPLFGFIGIVLGVVISVKSSGLRNEFNRIYKDTFVNAVLSEIFDNVDYKWEHGFDRDFVREFGLCQMGNRFSSEDYLRASYKGVNFEQADVKVWYKSSGKNSHTTIYFKGRMFVFDLPLKKVVSLKVFSDNFMYRSKSTDGFKLRKVEMESSLFNKQFDVFALNEHDAFYVLTPHVMERIAEINNTFRNVSMHFHGGRLYVGINVNGDAFDSNMSTKIDYLAEKDKAQRDAQVIIDIIDTLNDLMQNYDESEEKTVALFDDGDEKTVALYPDEEYDNSTYNQTPQNSAFGFKLKS